MDGKILKWKDPLGKRNGRRDSETGGNQLQFLEELSERIDFLKFDPSGNYLVAVSCNGGILVSPSCVREFKRFILNS
jgi:hypothetical protein